MTTTDPIRTVLFGLGKMGRFHYKTLQQDANFELLAIVDPVVRELPDKAKNFPLLQEPGPLWEMSPHVAVVVPVPTLLHIC